jgi:hypothetical protein
MFVYSFSTWRVSHRLEIASRKYRSSVLRILIESRFRNVDKDFIVSIGDSRESTSQKKSEMDLRSSLIVLWLETNSEERTTVERVRDSRFVNARKAMKNSWEMDTFCSDSDLIVQGNVRITVKRATASKYTRNRFNLRG